MAKIHAVSEGASAPAVEAVGLVKRLATTEELLGYVGKVLAAWSSKPLPFVPVTASVNPGASQ